MPMIALLLSLLASLSPCVFGHDVDIPGLRVDDECSGAESAEDACAVRLLQLQGQRHLLEVLDWAAAIEGADCINDGGITCIRDGTRRHFKFPAGVFTIDRQVTVPENTILEGAANPNDMADKTQKPDYSKQTVFVANEGVSDSHACYCQNLVRTWEPLSPRNPYFCQHLTIEQVRAYRKGFLMSSNTVVKNIAFQGKDTLRPADNGALCGGGVFETPGCVHNECKFSHLVTGDGKPVTNVLIQNVRLNDFSSNPRHASQLAVWTALTPDTRTPTSGVHVKNLVAMFLHADGINFHGFVQNSIVDDSYIQNTGDDIYAVWGNSFDTSGIVFQNSVGVDAGRARGNHYGSCVAVYGAREAAFRNLTCYAPEQNTHGCWDSKHRGETCNGCLGIIKESFGADYSRSVFTFTGNKFYRVKSVSAHAPSRLVYDLTNPQPTGRAEVCNHEWTKGGLTVNVNNGIVKVRDGTKFTSLGGTAVHQGQGIGSAKNSCDLKCCEAYCSQEPQCNSFAWSAKWRSCFLKEAVFNKGSPVTHGGEFSTFFKDA